MRQTKVFWQLVLVVGLALGLSVGCAKKFPQEVTDVNQALGQAKDACATVYAKDDLQSVQGGVDSMNALADDKKYKKAKKEAKPLLPQVQALGPEADKGRAAANQKSDAAIAAAGKVVNTAKSAGAEQYAGAKFKAASAKLEEARQMNNDPCKYPAAEAAAKQAATMAADAEQAAIAEKKRLEEEARLAEERRRREEAERLRREEEELLRRFPPAYTVERGDSLWKITGMERIYGHPKYWPIVHDANSGQIADPDLIYPGQELTIPRDITVVEMDQKLGVLWLNYTVD
jgi:nucleoid-associated protein YgaU